MSTPTRVAIVGAGQIAWSYAKDLDTYPELELAAVCDVVAERARDLAEAFGARPFTDLSALLAEDVDLVVNATIFEAHAPVTRACLAAGKHVYSEKPLASTSGEAWELVELARQQQVRLACAPCTILGEAQQTVWRLLREGSIGTTRTIYAEANGGRIEQWHPSPAPFFEIGPVFDIAIYPLTLLATMFGPVRRVAATGRVLRGNRTALDGTTFRVPTPDFVVAMLTFDDDVLLRLTTSFDLPRHDAGNAVVELHGDRGVIQLSDWQLFTAEVRRSDPEQPFTPVALDRAPRQQIENGRGVRELTRAIEQLRPHLGSAELAAHLVDVMEAIHTSVRTGAPVTVTTGFPTPAPPWESLDERAQAEPA